MVVGDLALELGAGSSLLNGLVEFWNLDGSSLVGNHAGIVLTAGGSAGLESDGGIAGDTGQMPFDGVDDVLTASGSDSRVQFGNADFTVSCWFWQNTAPASGQMILAKRAATPREFEISTALTAQVQAELFVGNLATTVAVKKHSGTYAADSWNFVAVRHSAVNDTFVIRLNNGAWESTASYSGTPGTNTVSMTMGACVNTTGPETFTAFLAGHVDAVGKWNRVLTDAEVDQLYFGGVGRQYPFIGT